MSPALMRAVAADRSFPRVSGDDPSDKDIPARLVMFSPRERG